MNYRPLLLCLLLFNGYNAYASSEPLAVIELFTSQGCYSCPPADSFLGKLKEQPNTIAVSCHVTYWNYLGWRDTFSRKFCDNRQRHYQRHLKGNAGVYTPQMVVSGRFGAVGSRTSRVSRIIDIAKKHAPLLPINLSIDASTADQLSIQLPTLNSDQTQQLFLLGTSGEHSLPISHGENGGKRLTYHNPIEHVVDLGHWDGQEKRLTQAIAGHPDIDEWVVIAQRMPIGEITAAGKLTLP